MWVTGMGPAPATWWARSRARPASPAARWLGAEAVRNRIPQAAQRALAAAGSRGGAVLVEASKQIYAATTVARPVDGGGQIPRLRVEGVGCFPDQLAPEKRAATNARAHYEEALRLRPVS